MAISHQPLKLALIGYGKMGKRVEALALARGHAVTSIDAADVCIDFSSPDAVLNTLESLAPKKKYFVIGTTGWYDKLPQVEKLVKEHSLGILYAPNFSVGVLLFLQVVEEAAKKFLNQTDYEVAGIEMHHKEKKDAPSGTALTIEKKIGRKVPFTSVRCGSIPGKHTVLFDSVNDQIALTHEARSRDGFALGAIKAAEWLNGKTGIYTLENLLKEEIVYA